MSKLIRLDNPIYITRNVHLKHDQGYGIGRTGLIKSWKVITPDIKLKMYINGTHINLDFLDGVYFDIPKIRANLRDILPECAETTNLCNIDSTLFGTQLLGTEYYRYFPSDFLFDFIFTGDLCITFDSDQKLPPFVELEEEFVISEAQLKQKLEQGIPLEKIGGKEEGVNMGF